ncbi:MAG: alcohol dehydrogenase catalytic domain-containing protein, partial [Solirubrobacterales bacterium]|nr:alcohol dehydrogenase catalytic domain-containing protein [Solirubrobacterales bacterium]
MKAAVLHAPEDLRVEEVQEPEGEVILEVLAATTCGTDVKMWRHGHRALAPYPCLFGHETAGRRLDTGERVLVSDSVACGSCAPCRAGRAQICRSPTWVLGGFAQRIGAPAAALHPIPEGLPPAAAAMAEPLAAVLHAIARGSGATDVGVLGGGSIGLMLAGLLAREGRSVLVADRHPERREQATALGARAAPRLAKHELVFEAVGRPEAWRQAICSAGPGAVVVLVGGCPGGTEVSFPSGPIHYDELDVRGTFHHAPAEVDQALRVLAGGEFPWSLLAGEAIG